MLQLRITAAVNRGRPHRMADFSFEAEEIFEVAKFFARSV